MMSEASESPTPIQKLSDLRSWDFTKVKVRLVASVPAKKTGGDFETIGHARLGKLIREAGWTAAKGKRTILECQVSCPMISLNI